MAALDGLSAQSWFAVFRKETEQDYLAIFSKVKDNTGGSYDGWALQFWLGGELLARVSNNNVKGGETTDLDLVLGTWYAACMVYDGAGATDADKIKLWVNGTQKTLSHAAWTPVPSSIGPAAADVEVGTIFSGSTEGGIDGDVAEFASWNRALSATEAVKLTTISAGCYAPSFFTEGLVLYAKLTGNNSPEPATGSYRGTVIGAVKSAHPDFMRYPGDQVNENFFR